MGQMIIRPLDSDVLGAAEMNVTNSQIIEGYWWNNKIISKAYLEQTVTFKVKTQNMNGKLLSFKLYDDELEKINGSVNEWRTVSNNQAEVKLELKKYWMLDIFKAGHPMKLYWEVADDRGTCDSKRLPSKKENYLTVMPQLLYVASQKSSNKPYLYEQNGSSLLVYELTQNISSAFDELSASKAKNYDYVVTMPEKTGLLGKIKGAIDYGGNVLDAVSVVRSGGKNITDLALPLVGNLAPLVVVADLIVSDLCARLEEDIHSRDLEAIQQIKQKGFYNISKYVSNADPEQDRFTFLPVTPKVAIDILHGKYSAISDINQNNSTERSVMLFLRIIRKGSLEINIVESFYFNNL